MKKDTKQDKNTMEEAVDSAPVAQKIIENKPEDKVGGMLKEARLKKGLKIADISKELYIRKAYLEAIEGSNYEEIPESPYGIGFIRTYAEYLGLNSSRIVQLFKEETVANSQPEDLYVLEPQSEATIPSKKYILMSLLGAILLYVAWLTYNENQMAEPQEESEMTEAVVEVQPESEFPLQVEDFATVENAQENAIQVIDVSSTPTAEKNAQVTINEANFVDPEEDKKPTTEPTAEAESSTQTLSTEETSEVQKEAMEQEDKLARAKENARIVLQAREETWVEVKNKDGSKLWISKVLKAGDIYQVPAGEGKILSVGKVNGVDVYVDGKLTTVVTPRKKMGIALDKFLSANH